MKSYRRLLVYAAFLLLALGAFMLTLRNLSLRPPGQSTSAPPSPPRPAETLAPAITATAPVATPSPVPPPPIGAERPSKVRLPASKPLPEIFPHQAEREAIQQLATTYDPKVLPQIAPYLTHADATVRFAAVNAMIQIGHADAIPLLKAALPKIASDEEAENIREAIEFLQIPPANSAR